MAKLNIDDLQDLASIINQKIRKLSANAPSYLPKQQRKRTNRRYSVVVDASKTQMKINFGLTSIRVKGGKTAVQEVINSIINESLKELYQRKNLKEKNRVEVLK